MTKTEIINETVKYYLQNNRAIKENGGCAYYYNGNMCAVGRCINDPEKLKDSGSFVHYLMCNNKISFKEQYTGHEVEFWSQLQSFHDWNDYWQKEHEGNRLTDKGITKLEELLTFWENK